ncbi:DNA-3-methyladenine glycosylase I [Parachitinimonas caeni]|uniref:DNA-3-methyladenine glycosylase I n=1 Tax=Parachitinimonas caeni TaxID=3031301 RepID=A0ABT7DYK2_9NEIS|nr:DNA-3-methyladenine glycosylase I [Parachitinimonas caeni]MDK2124225.1 DNA-3-methyladenine glycosylase I [Parachitinimonas caeni]
MNTSPIRCGWANPANPLYLSYHDDEWGVPCHDDRHLFEMLILEGAQAGLSWETILNKREAYRAAFDHFDAEKIAHYDGTQQSLLLQNAGIVRNRLKIAAAIANAQAYLKLRDSGISLDQYLWQFVDGQPIQNAWSQSTASPTSTPLSDAISKDLKKRGFKFVGTTIIYAYMQAVGLVNDHCIDCFRHQPVRKLANA